MLLQLKYLGVHNVLLRVKIQNSLIYIYLARIEETTAIQIKGKFMSISWKILGAFEKLKLTCNISVYNRTGCV